MRLPAAVVSLVLLSCSSSSPPAGADAASGGDGPAAVDTPSATEDTAAATPDSGAGGEASEACRKYCECMAKNCAERMFPGGCLAECAGHPKWDLPCRQNMCNLVPAQPNNDHCTHAFGLFQCLDKP